MKNIKILIIGGTSSLGRALKPILSEFSEVVTAGRKGSDIKLDLTDPIRRISIPNNIDVIIHTAAHFGGSTIKGMLEAENVNVLGSLKLCQVAVQKKVKHFILISSMYSCLTNDSKFYNIYAISKRHSEEIASFYCTLHSLLLTILRPSQIYGNEDNFRVHQPIFYGLVDKAEKGEDITLYGSNDALRNYIHIDDVANIIARVVQHKVGGIYSCMYPTNLAYSQIAKAAMLAFNSKGHVVFLKAKPDIPNNIFKKDDSLYKIIGFYPKISIEEGMKKMALYRKIIK